MLSPYQRIIFLTVFGLLIGCSRLSNSNVDLQLECGADAGDDKAFVKLNLPASEAFEAVWLDKDGPHEAHRSSKNCIEIPANAPSDAKLLIRSLSGLNGRVLSLDEGLRGVSLTRVEFEQNARLRAEFFQLACVAETTAASRILPLRRSSQPSSRLIYNMGRFQLSDAEGQIVGVGDIADDATSLDLPPDLPEGRYHLTLSARDALNLQDPPRESQCEVVLDRSAPSVKMLVGDVYVSPGQRIEFEVSDAQKATVYGCMLERRNEEATVACADEEFKPMGPLSAPEKGMWDIYYYAQDALGHRSPLNLGTIAVFHEDQIKQFKSLTLLSIAQESIWKQFAAFTALQEAANIVKGFLLNAERQAIKWDFLKSLWDLNMRLGVRNQQVYPSWDKLAGENLLKTVSDPRSDVWVMLTNKGRAAIFIDSTQVTAFEAGKNAVFGPDGSLYILSDQDIRKYPRPKMGSTPAFEIVQSVGAAFDRLEISGSGELLVASGNESILVYRILGKSSKAYAIPWEIMDPLETPSRFRMHFSVDETFIYYNLGWRIMGIDLINQKQKELFKQPSSCVITSMELRGNTLYVANKFLSHLSVEAEPPVCGFNVLPILADGSLGTMQHPFYPGSSQDVEGLTLDASRNILVLAQHNLVSKNVDLFIADLRREPLQFVTAGLPNFDQQFGPQGGTPNFDQDTFVAFEIDSFKRKKLLIHTKKGLGTFEYTDQGSIALRLFVKLTVSLNCKALASKEMILCGDAQSRAVNFHDSDENTRLQPRIVAGPVNNFLVVSSRTGIRFSDSNITDKMELRSAEGPALWTLPRPGSPKVGGLSPMAHYAVMATADKTLYLYDQKGFLAQKTLDLKQNIDAVSVTDSGKIFLLLSQGNDKELVTYQRVGNELVGHSTATWTNAARPNRILINPTNEFLIVYNEVLQSWRPVRQNIAIFDGEGALKKQIDADNTRISFNADDRSWFRILGHEVWRYELENDQEIKIADSLPYAPNEVFEGEVPIAKAGEAIYSLTTGKKLLPDGVVGLIEGNLLVWTSSSSGMVRIYSADGSKVLLEQEGQPNEKLTPLFVFSDGKSPTFHLWRYNQLFSVYVDSYTLDLHLAMRWISLWNNNQVGQRFQFREGM